MNDFAHLIPQGDGRTLAKQEVFNHLYLGVWAVIGADVRGDIAEFGTHTGMTACVLAKSLADNSLPDRPTKRLLLLDSFEGLPNITASADADSPHIVHGHWTPGLCRGANPDELRDMVTAYLPEKLPGELPGDRVTIVPGWYADSLATLPDDTRLGLLHLDCDLYQSTLDALSPCFSRGFITDGAHLYFDDWNCNRASPKYGQRKAWRELTDQFNITFSPGNDYAAFGHKLIVHDYTHMPVD